MKFNSTTLRDPFNNLGESRKYITLGAEIMSALVGPIIIGLIIDYYFNSTPWGFVVGVILGFVLVMMTLVKIVSDG